MSRDQESLDTERHMQAPRWPQIPTNLTEEEKEEARRITSERD